jgi:hypothetical protein
MIKSIEEKKPQVEIDLTGPDGNAFVLMGYVKMWSKSLGIDSKPIITDMMSGNYEHLLSVIENHFGDYVILYR